MKRIILHKTKRIISILLFCYLSPLVLGQGGMMEGIVISASGDPVQDVTITVKEKPKVKTFTDAEGNFSINLEEGQHLIVNYKNQVLKTLKYSELDMIKAIVLDKQSELVNVGFNTKLRKGDLVSSIGSASSEDLENISVFTPGNALFGQIAGLRVFQNAGYFPNYRQPGMDIRGLSTTRDNSILVIVDGVERPLNTLVLEEIESVSVLRDAAAKAKYGQRGANGVLLVSTKRGGKGKTRFSFSYEQGMTQPTRLPEFLNAAGYARAVNEAQQNDGKTDLRYSPTDIANFESGNYPYLWPDVDWVDQTLNDMGKLSKFNFSSSGGSEKVNFYMGLNLQNEKGLYNHTDNFEDFSTQLDYNKINFRTNVDVNLTSTTLVEIGLGGYFMYNQGPSNFYLVDDAFSIPSALFPVKNFDGSWGGTNLYGNNPVAQIGATGFSKNLINSYSTNLRIIQDLNSFVKGMSVEAMVVYDNRTDFWENKTQTYQYKEVIPVLNESGSITDTILNELGEDTKLTASRYPGDIHDNHYALRFRLNYDKTFGDHDLKTWILYQAEEEESHAINTVFRQNNLAANIHYGMAGKYYVDATLSYFGTNLIQNADERYGLFPAIAAGWVISNEPFLSGSGFINDLRLRASYGKVGNGRIPATNLTVAKYGPINGYVFGNGFEPVGGYDEIQIPIESKTYESSYESNMGLSAVFFDKLSFNGDLFFMKRKNIFVPSASQYSEVLGIIPEQINNGITENSGFELDLTWTDKSGDFSYFVTGMFSRVKSEIIEMNEEFRPYEYMKREGQPIGQYFGWESAGLYADQSDIDNSPVSNLGIVRPGDIKYIDQNNDGFIDEFDEQPIGYSYSPEIYYSATVGIGYKGFQISALIQGTANQSVYLNQPHVFWPLQVQGNISTWYDDYWTSGNTDAKLPRLTSEANQNNFRPNDIWIRDGSFLKLRYAEISYTLPDRLVNNLRLQKLKIYLRGRDLFSMDKIDYVDPENTYSTYPTLKTFTAGINVVL